MDVSAVGESETEQRHSLHMSMTLSPPCDVYKAEVDKADEYIEDGEEDEKVVDGVFFWFLSIITA